MTTMTTRRRKAGAQAAPPRDTAWDASRLRAAWDRAAPDPTKIAASLDVTTETLRRWRLGLYAPDALEVRLLARALGTTADAILPPE